MITILHPHYVDTARVRLLTIACLNPRLWADSEPRLSQGQREAMLKVAKVDPHAWIEGLDQKHHPVVRAKLGGPNHPTRYALLKDGSSTVVRGNRLAETWR